MTNKVSLFKVYVSEAAIAAVTNVLRSGWIGEGPVVAQFENSIREQLRIPFPITLNSCTTALHLAHVMAGVKACDEVITTAQTMMATSHVILAQQAKPVFADVQYDTGNIDPNDIERRITPRTKAISVVHWAGYPCDMDEVKQIAGRHGLAVIEDAAHAIGASYRGKPIGTISDYTCFSFQAIKHVTTGDGGMLSVLTQAKYEEARRRRWYGLDRDKRVPSPLGEAIFNVTEVGYKAHMNDIAAAMGLEHLKEFDRIFARRHKIARHYREELA